MTTKGVAPEVAVSREFESFRTVGKPGVSDKLPDGYDWNKRHRGMGPGAA